MLKGETTGLRALEAEDLQQLRDWRNKAGFRRFYREFRELNMDDQRAWLAAMNSSRNHLMLGITDLDGGALLGVCGLTNIDWRLASAELSLYIGHDDIYVDERHALDALNTLVRYAFDDLNMNKVWAEIYEFDTAKEELFAVWAGFREDGRIRDNGFDQGRYWDSILYSLLRGEYEARLGRIHPAPGSINWRYYAGQFETPYRSTVLFHEWLKEQGAFVPDGVVLDMGAGSGSVLSHFAVQEPATRFVGLDVIDEVTAFGNRTLGEMGLANAGLEYGDLFGLNGGYAGQVDGIYSTHFMLLFDDFRTPLHHMLRYEPRWIAANSLFFDGNVETCAARRDYNSPGGGRDHARIRYNTFSLPRVREYLASRGYTVFAARPFDIDVDLPRGDSDIGTYTVLGADGSRLQISGPMLMNWQFIFAAKG